MSLAKFRKVGGRQGAGRFVVSEGIAPSAYLLPHPGLPTQYFDDEDDRFEIVLTKGVLLSVVKDANDDSRIVPANGTGSTVTWGDVQAGFSPDTTGATPTTTTGSVDTIAVPAWSTVIGAAQYDLYRPFDKGTSQGSGWITRGYVEWPMVQGVNADLLPGDLVRADALGRPAKCSEANAAAHPQSVVGKAVEVEYFATNYDDGLLSYMQLPSDPGALQHVYELTKAGPYTGKLGIRANLDVHNVVGAVRVNLNI